VTGVWSTGGGRRGDREIVVLGGEGNQRIVRGGEVETALKRVEKPR